MNFTFLARLQIRKKIWCVRAAGAAFCVIVCVLVMQPVDMEKVSGVKSSLRFLISSVDFLPSTPCCVRCVAFLLLARLNINFSSFLLYRCYESSIVVFRFLYIFIRL